MKHILKFIFDRITGIIAFVILLPIVFTVSLAILLSNGWPVFFIQKRVGRHGKLFRMIKFCTMRPNDSKNTVSVKGDSRITKTGAFLRKYKIDELPKLFNVVIGQMSFVGPRPDVPGYADLLEGEDRKILTLRPGITGPGLTGFIAF